MDDADDQSHTERERFVEEVGILMEQEGMPRMAARILGWLLICDPPLQSANELASALHASRGSISTMTQFLIRFGVLERVGVPGERQDFFRIRPGAGTYVLERQLRQMRTLLHLFQRGLPLVSDQPPVNQERLRELHALYAFFEHHSRALLERWHAERTGPKPS